MRLSRLGWVATVLTVWFLAAPAEAAEDMTVQVNELRAVGPSLRASIDLRDVFTDKFRTILQDGGRLHLRIQAELWEDRPLWDKLVRPAIVTVFRIVRDPTSQVTVSDSVGIVTQQPWDASGIALRVEVAATDLIADNRKYYLRLVATVGTIGEKALETTGDAVFGRGESAVSVARVGKVLFNTVLQINDYLQSMTAEGHGPVLSGKELKTRR